MTSTQASGRRSAVATLALIALVCLAQVGLGTRSWRPLVFAHRGDTSVAAENTIAAIRAASGWADGVEFDVHLAPDGSWRLSHEPLPLGWEDLPTLPDAVAAAAELLIEIDLKELSNEAHRLLAEWIAQAGIAGRTTVNVKSLSGARLVTSIAPGTTIEAQPEWVPEALTAPEVDLVAVWGDDWRHALEARPRSEIVLFVNSIHEPGLSRWAEAVATGIARYEADGPPNPEAP